MDKSSLGLTQVFWGNGKGKTTTTIGTALRALDNGYSVHLVQFMKNGTGNPELAMTGEVRALEKFPGFSFKRFGAEKWIIGKPDKDHLKSASDALEHLKQSFTKYDIIIADEILYAIQLNLLKESQILELIKSKPDNQELWLTGSHKPFPKIFELVDLVTEIKKIKHPYDNGIIARKGIEY